jgi:hypothetical protein
MADTAILGGMIRRVDRAGDDLQPAQTAGRCVRLHRVPPDIRIFTRTAVLIPSKRTRAHSEARMAASNPAAPRQDDDIVIETAGDGTTDRHGEE